MYGKEWWCMKEDDWFGLPIKKVDGAKLARKRTSTQGHLSTSYFVALEEERKKSAFQGGEVAKNKPKVDKVSKPQPMCIEGGGLKHKTFAQRSHELPNIAIDNDDPKGGQVEDETIAKCIGKEETIVTPKEKKDFWDWRPFGIPKRCFLVAIWVCVIIATWCITHDKKATLVATFCTPFLVGFGLFFASMMVMVGGMILLFLNESFNAIIPIKCRKIKWCIIIPLWVALPIWTITTKGDVQRALLIFAMTPLFVYMLLYFVGLFGSWIISACEVENPILKILAIIGVLLLIGLIIAIGISSKDSGYDDYDQWDRRDPTYRMR